MDRLGFKELALDNWLEPDKSSTLYARPLPSGEIKLVDGEDWLQSILKPRLNDTVPIIVRDLFDVARGALAYGYFFYPLYTLAEEQFYRVVETAVSLKYTELGGSKPKKANFEKKIDWLFDNGGLTDTSDARRAQAIDEYKSLFPDFLWTDDTEIHIEGLGSEKVSWHAIRGLRNRASHPERQSIHMPVTALRTLIDIAMKINTLFPEAQKSAPGSIE